MKRWTALLLIVLLLAACSKAPQTSTETGTENQATTAETAKEDKFGGTVTIGTYADPDTLNPLTGNDIAGSWILDNLYPRMMRFNPEGVKTPYVIQKPEVSEDGLTIKVKVVPGIKWADGVPFTSKDIAFTCKVQQEQKLQWQWSMLEGVSWETPDDQTIIFTMEEPYPDFITSLGYWQRIVPEHIWSKVEDIKNFANDDPVGMGPFKLTKYERGSYYQLERMEEWFLSPEGKPYVEKIIFKPYADSNTMILALKSGDIDLTAKNIPMAAAKELQGDSNFKVVDNQDLGYEHIAFNLKNEKLQDVTVRKAFAMTIDRQKIVDFAYDGSAQPMTGIISPVYQTYQYGIDFPALDIQGAIKLLESAGYKDSDGDGILNAPSGANLEFKLMYASPITEHEKIAKIVADGAGQIGIKIIPTPLDKALQTEKLYKSGDWEMSMGTWGIIDDVTSSMATLYHSTAGLNWMGWKNEKADAAIEAMKASVDPAEIEKNMKIFQREFVQDIPDVCMVVKRNNYAYAAKLQDIQVYPSTLEGVVNPGVTSCFWIEK